LRTEQAARTKKEETKAKQYAEMPKQVQDVLDIFKGEIKG
jgi:hypothetical protein